MFHLFEAESWRQGILDATALVADDTTLIDSKGPCFAFVLRDMLWCMCGLWRWVTVAGEIPYSS